jgi:hypothetical protein
MANLFETINTIRAKGVNTPRPRTDDKTVPTVQGDMQAGKVEPNPADDYKAVKNKMAQVKHKIIDENNGETDMPQEKVSASFLEAIKQVRENSIALDEKKKHKKAKPDFLDLDKDGNEEEPMKKAAKEMKKEEVEQIDEIGDTPAGKANLIKYIKKASGADGGSDKSLPTLVAKTAVLSNKGREETKKGDWLSARNANKSAENAFQKSWKRREGIGRAADRIAKEEVELEEAATVLLRKGGSTKRMRYNPTTIEKMKSEGWVVVSEEFVEKVKAIFNIAEDISYEDAIALVEEEQAKRGRGRPKKAVDPNAAPKKTWTPGGRGRPPKNKDAVSKVSTSDTKAAAPAAKEPEKADAGDTQHILVQLRKAATNEPGESGSGKNTIKYLNGSTGQVTAAQARSALTKHDQLKTSGDRFKAQRRMGGSHEGLTGFMSGKEEKSTAKPKVSLAQPGWNKK